MHTSPPRTRRSLRSLRQQELEMTGHPMRSLLLPPTWFVLASKADQDSSRSRPSIATPFHLHHHPNQKVTVLLSQGRPPHLPRTPLETRARPSFVPNLSTSRNLPSITSTSLFLRPNLASVLHEQLPSPAALATASLTPPAKPSKTHQAGCTWKPFQSAHTPAAKPTSASTPMNS